MDDSLTPFDTYTSLVRACFGFGGFLYNHNTWKFEPPAEAPVPVESANARVERLQKLDSCYDDLDDALASADALADGMDPKCWQSIQVAIAETRQLMYTINPDLDYTEPQQFDRLSATVNVIFRKQYAALMQALARLEILCGYHKLDPNGTWTEQDWETFFGAKNMEPSEQRRVLSGLCLDLDWNALFKAEGVEAKDSIVPAEDVERIRYKLDETGILTLEVQCTGRGPFKFAFHPHDGEMTNQAKLLLCVLRGRGTATLAQVAKALWPNAISSGKHPRDIPRNIGTTAHHINRKAGVKLIEFHRHGVSGTARAASSNIIDRSTKESGKGTLPGDRENN